jgi:hypothetical protein
VRHLSLQNSGNEEDDKGGQESRPGISLERGEAAVGQSVLEGPLVRRYL